MTSHQEEILVSFSNFLDAHFLSTSHEKQSVTMLLVLEMVKLVPAEFIPVIVSKSLVRCMMTARRQKKNILYNLAGHTIEELVKLTSSDSKCRLALASVFVNYGNANFDSYTGTSAVSRLLEDLDMNALASHIKYLCGVIGSSKSEEAMDTNNSDDDDEDEAGSANTCAAAKSAIEALAALAKNTKIANRGQVGVIIVSVLTRISCFGAGRSKKVKSKTSPAVLSVVPDLMEYIHLCEESYTESPFHESLASLAALKLQSLLSDIGRVTVAQLSTPAQQGSEKGESNATAVASPTILQAAFDVVNLLHRAELPFLRDTHEEEGATKDEFVRSVKLIDSMEALSQPAEAVVKAVDAISLLVKYAVFQMLTSTDIDHSAIEDLVTSCTSVLTTLAPPKEQGKKRKASDLDEDDDGPLPTLLDACVDLLSVIGDQSIAGTRHAVVKLWTLIPQVCEVDLDLIDSVIDAVLGEDADDNEDEEGKDGKEDSEGSDDDEDAMDTGAGEDEEEIFISGADALNLLVDDMDDSDSDAGADSKSKKPKNVLEHDESADGALINMLNLRKQSRKQGLMEAKRKQLIVRSRIIDILEAIMSRCEKSDLILCIFLPLLKVIKKIKSSSIALSLQEGKVYEARLRALFEKTISKKRFNLIVDNNDPGSCETVVEEVTAILSLLFEFYTGKESELHSLALTCILTLARAIINGNSLECKQLLIQSLCNSYEKFNTKKSNSNSKLYDEMFTRFPSFMLTFDHAGVTFLHGIVGAMVNEKLNLYKKVEGIKLLMNVIKRFKGLEVESQSCFYQQNADGIISGVNYILDGGPQVDQKSETREIRAIRLKPILQFSKDYLLILKQYVETSQKGLWNSNTIASPIPLTNFIKIMKSESVTSLSNSPRVAKLIQDIRAIVEVITINPKDFTDSQVGKTKAVKGKAAVSEKTEEPKAAVDTASKAKAVKGKAAATVEAAEEPKVTAVQAAGKAKAVKGKAAAIVEVAEEPKVAAVEATVKTKKGKTVTIETPEEPKVVVETAVKPTKAAAKGKAAVTVETPEEPKKVEETPAKPTKAAAKGKATASAEPVEEPNVVVETAVKPTKATKGKAVEKAKSPDVSSRTRSKKPKN